MIIKFEDFSISVPNTLVFGRTSPSPSPSPNRNSLSNNRTQTQTYTENQSHRVSISHRNAFSYPLVTTDGKLKVICSNDVHQYKSARYFDRHSVEFIASYCSKHLKKRLSVLNLVYKTFWKKILIVNFDKWRHALAYTQSRKPQALLVKENALKHLEPFFTLSSNHCVKNGLKILFTFLYHGRKALLYKNFIKWQQDQF